ncbi:MAG: hypothetical protein ACFCVH_12370 [Alphaproteobacteria bacterium]
MFNAQIRRKALAVAAVAVTGMLGACIAMPPAQPGQPSNPGGVGGPAPVQQPPVAPPIDATFGTSNPGDQIRIVSGGNSQDPNKVRVCLRNSASGVNKGMHFQPGDPRYVTTRRGDVVCDEHPAGPHTVTWYFHRTEGIGRLRFVGTYQFNATGYAGQTITFDWISDYR